jgi:hypothetical protein
LSALLQDPRDWSPSCTLALLDFGFTSITTRSRGLLKLNGDAGAVVTPKWLQETQDRANAAEFGKMWRIERKASTVAGFFHVRFVPRT